MLLTGDGDYVRSYSTGSYLTGPTIEIYQGTVRYPVHQLPALMQAILDEDGNYYVGQL